MFSFRLHIVLNSDELIREALVKRGDEFSDRPITDIGGITDCKDYIYVHIIVLNYNFQ